MPYLTPDSIPEDGDCRPLSIPASSEWFALVSGALTELLKPYNWVQFGAVSVEDTIARFQVMVDQYYEGGCGGCELPEGGAILRLGLDGEVEQLIDGTWTTPTGDYVIPPPDARTEPTADERRCLAAANAENVLKLMYEDVTDSFGSSLGTLEALASLALFVVTLIAPPVSLAVRALGLAALGVWQLAFDTAEFVTADFWTTNFSNDLRCALLRHSIDTSGVVTFDFDAVNGELLSQVEWFDPSLASFALAAQVRWLLGQIGSGGLNLAGATTAVTSFDCDICEACAADSVNFGLGTQGFNPDAWDIFSAVGSHMNSIYGVGWYAGTAGGSNVIGLSGAVNEVCGTGIQINLRLTGGAPTTPTMKVRVTTSTQVKTATWTPGDGANTACWDEGGSLVPDSALVEIGYLGASGYAAFVASFQTGDITGCD